jgi:hypothetical protein
MSKLFTVAGRSRCGGCVKYRFTNDREGRVPVMIKTGHTEIELYDLPEPMTREAATQWLIAQGVLLDTPAQEGSATAVTVVRKPRNTSKPKANAAADGFVEPADQLIQSAMSRLARQYPGLGRQQLYHMVMLTAKHFGDVEPNF